MADLVETIAMALFGTTTPQANHIKRLQAKLVQVRMTAPANMQTVKPVSVCDVKIETSCCKCSHTIRLLDSNGRVVNSCTPVMTCVPAPDGPDGFGICSGFTMPSADGCYSFEIEVDGSYTTGSTINVQTGGLLGWLRRFLGIE